MLGKYIKINGLQLPNPVSYDENMSSIENDNTTESGKTLVAVVRLDLFSANMTFNLSSYWKDKIRDYCKENYVTLEVNGKEYQVRLRGYSAKLVENSERSEGTDGYWKVSVTATEL